MNCIYSLKAIMNLTTIDPHDNLTRKFGFSKDYFALKKDALKECSSKRTINFLKFDFLNMFFFYKAFHYPCDLRRDQFGSLTF